MRYFRLTQIAAEYAQGWGNAKPAAIDLELTRAAEDALVFGMPAPDQAYFGTCDEGPLPDFPFTIPQVSVVSQRLLPLFAEQSPGAVQILDLFLRRAISGEPVSGYSIANIVTVVDCVDRLASRDSIYTRDNYPHWAKYPDKLGQFRSFDNLVLSRAAMEGQGMFRVKGWEGAIVVTETIVQAIEAMRLTGCQLQEVNTTK